MLRCRESGSGHYDSFERIIKTVKEPGCKANVKEQKHFQFELPLLETDISDEAQLAVKTDRTSRAVMKKDLRAPAPILHNDNDSDDNTEKPKKDVCPSWMGQVFQIQYWLKVYVKWEEDANRIIFWTW